MFLRETTVIISEKENDTDEELVLRIVRGDVQTFAQLVERYQRPVFNLMYRYSRSRQEAADLTQDVFLRAYERLETFDGKRKFFPWLYTIAVNRAKDWQRSNGRKLRRLEQLRWETPHRDFGSQQEKHLQRQEDTRMLYGALDQLTDTTRELVLLRYRQELPIRDLAEIFNLSESAVKMRISRALDQMKSFLGGEQ